MDGYTVHLTRMAISSSKVCRSFNFFGLPRPHQFIFFLASGLITWHCFPPDATHSGSDVQLESQTDHNHEYNSNRCGTIIFYRYKLAGQFREEGTSGGHLMNVWLSFTSLSEVPNLLPSLAVRKDLYLNRWERLRFFFSIFSLTAFLQEKTGLKYYEGITTILTACETVKFIKEK